MLSVNVLDVAEDDDLNNDKNDVVAVLCCHAMSKVLHDVDVHLDCEDTLPPLKMEGSEVDEVDQDEPVDVEVVVYSPFFFDADDVLVLFPDVDLDNDEPVEVVGKMPDVDVKVTVLKDPYDNVDVDAILYVVL